MKTNEALIRLPYNEYVILYLAAPKILKGRRGNSSRKSRVRKKLAQEVLSRIVTLQIEEMRNNS